MKDIIFVGEACEFVIGFLIKLTNGFSVGTNLNSKVKGISLAYVNDICARIKKVKDDYEKDGIFDGRASRDLGVLKSIIDTINNMSAPARAFTVAIDEITFRDNEIIFNIKGEEQEMEEPSNLSEESLQAIVDHYKSLLETVRAINKKHAEEEGKAKHEKELMDKAAKFERRSQESFGFGIGASTLENYKRDWSFLKYVDIKKVLVDSLYYQGNEAVKMLLKLKEFKEILRTDGFLILKCAIENIITHPGDGSGYIEDFCTLVTTHEIKSLIRCDAMLNLYRDLEQERRDMYKYENFRNMMFILRTEVYGLNDGEFYTPYKNALINEILGND